jgi:hypothetical protein
MEEWVERALKRWPNVPALYGWLKLDRRGRWLIKGELISRPQIIDVFNGNYAADERGCWYFQNGPQRGYMELERAPLILNADGEDLRTHNRLTVASVEAAYLDEHGGVYFRTEHGPGALIDSDLEWALERMSVNGRSIQEDEITETLASASGTKTSATLRVGSRTFALARLDSDQAAQTLGFVLEPKPS